MSRRHVPVPLLATLLAAGVVAMQVLLVCLFAWPAANAEPRDLPVVVAGPAPAADQLAARLNAQPEVFDITLVPDASAADKALRDREAYAAFVAGPEGVALHTASAASPAVAALITQAATQLSVQTGRQVRVTDVVATDPDDPRGTGFAAGFLPLAMSSVVFGFLIVLAVLNRVARLLGVLAFALFAGLVATSALQQWLGILPDQYLAGAAAIGLFALAASATVAGLNSALGYPGLVLGTLLVFLVGNPLSGVSAAPELLPRPWGEVGQWLPVGAGGSVLRSAVYFDWAGAGRPAAVLVGYALVGIALVAAAPRRARRDQTAYAADGSARLTAQCG